VQRRSFLAAFAMTCALAAACGGGGGSDTKSSTTTSEAATVTTYGGVPGAAQRVACENDVRQLQQLSDYYKTLKGHPAPSLQTFVDDGSIDHVPTNDHGYVIGYDATTGHVSATGACTSP
jgi:hypothetical protein